MGGPGRRQATLPFSCWTMKGQALIHLFEPPNVLPRGAQTKSGLCPSKGQPGRMRRMMALRGCSERHACLSVVGIRSAERASRRRGGRAGSPGSPCEIPAQSSAPKRPLQWPDLAEGRLDALIACAQQRRQNFLPLPASPSFLASQESSSSAVGPLHRRRAPGGSGCAVDPLRPADRHRGRNGAGSKLQIKEN